MKKIIVMALAIMMGIFLSACDSDNNANGTDASNQAATDGPQLIDITESTWFSAELLEKVGSSGLVQPDNTLVHDRIESEYEYKIFISPLSEQDFASLIVSAYDVITQNNGAAYELNYEKQEMQKFKLTETDTATNRISFYYKVEDLPYQIVLERWPEESYYFPENTVAISFSSIAEESEELNWAE